LESTVANSDEAMEERQMIRFVAYATPSGSPQQAEVVERLANGEFVPCMDGARVARGI
jgi:hypothetical protein